MPGDLDRKIDQLYTVPLDEFVERRTDLARSLRKDGDREAADEVTGLRKPTVPAWALNQLARREKMRLRGLLTAGERLRKAHEKLLGGGSPEALQQARDDERTAIAELAGAAASLLTEAGHPASEATLDRVRKTLHAAAADEEIGQRVRAGRLEREEAATGFGIGSPQPAARAKPATEAKRGRGSKERQAQQAEAAREKAALERRAEQEKKARKKRRAEERLREARSALREAERAVQRQARELERSEAALQRRQAEAESAERELEQARRSPGPR
ncbi:MAG: hypothetical protein ACRDNE_13480 [Gaiellaceae bacterium]